MLVDLPEHPVATPGCGNVVNLVPAHSEFGGSLSYYLDIAGEELYSILLGIPGQAQNLENLFLRPADTQEEIHEEECRYSDIRQTEYQLTHHKLGALCEKVSQPLYSLLNGATTDL